MQPWHDLYNCGGPTNCLHRPVLLSLGPSEGNCGGQQMPPGRPSGPSTRIRHAKLPQRAAIGRYCLARGFPPSYTRPAISWFFHSYESTCLKVLWMDRRAAWSQRGRGNPIVSLQSILTRNPMNSPGRRNHSRTNFPPSCQAISGHEVLHGEANYEAL